MKTILLTLIGLSALALPAAAQTYTPQQLQLAREAIKFNSPRDALLAGTTPLAGHPMFQQVFARLDFNKINEQAAELMAQTFTADEIKALIDFLSSPAGQRISMKMPGYQMLVGSMLQNEMKATFEGLVLSEGAKNSRSSGANGPALQGLSPLPGR